jgi:GTP-binding protein LepA
VNRTPTAQERIRNFSIIAHIDHGKSTLADRLLEFTHSVAARDMVDQLLDQMDLERERGITIKAQAVRLAYQAQDGQEYELNLIDTPGHVDFNYEVSRSLGACEGALLVVDASQGVEAQTLANLYLALDHNLTIIPVINKIDLPSADPERVKRELAELGLDPAECILASAKTGVGTEEILEAVVQRVPPPQGDRQAPLRALIFDSHYDSYRGVIAYVRLMEGRIKVGDRFRMMSSGHDFETLELACFRPAMEPVGELAAGEVGCVISNIKEVQESRVGDTITGAEHPAGEPLPGFRKVTSMVFCGLYPAENDDYDELRDALEKLQLNDASLSYEPETSTALGFGFRCGFLGLLHMDIVQERLEREYNLNLITTAPSVRFRVRKTDGTLLDVDNPAKLPQPTEVESIAEPFVRGTIIVPTDFVGTVMELCREKRATYRTMEYLDPTRVMLTYSLPLAEILLDFFDKLKSRTKGYASFDYDYEGHVDGDLVKLDILVNDRPVDALSCIVHREKAYSRGRQLAEKLRQIIPRQLFEIPIQAAIGGRVVARETVKAMRKDVLAKCYGGDVTRKRKLLEKQKEGKKRMKNLGNVEIPQEAFMAVLQIED